MTKKIKLVETSITQASNINNTSTDQVVEDLDIQKKPDFNITDVTVLPDNDYNPTIQSLLINIEESQTLNEAEKLGFNILSETVNEKTGYSSSLFEFETANKNITLNLSMTESDKYDKVWKVSAHTTKGELVFESNTQYPQKVITNYLNSLSSEYLLESSLKENETSQVFSKFINTHEDKLTQEQFGKLYKVRDLLKNCDYELNTSALTSNGELRKQVAKFMNDNEDTLSPELWGALNDARESFGFKEVIFKESEWYVKCWNLDGTEVFTEYFNNQKDAIAFADGKVKEGKYNETGVYNASNDECIATYTK